MHYITIDADNKVTGIYDGSRDTINRITLEPTPNSVQIPAGAIPIQEECLAKLRTLSYGVDYKWDSNSNCIVEDTISDEEEAKRQLLEKNTPALVAQEHVRISALTLPQVLAELGGV